GSGGSVHVGAFPVPMHLPTSQAVYCGQSQSSSQGHAASPMPGSLHVLGKYDWLPHVNFTTSPPPFGVHSWSSCPTHVCAPGTHRSSTQILPSQYWACEHCTSPTQLLSEQ